MKMTLVHVLGLLVISVQGAMDCQAWGCGFPKTKECIELISGSWHLKPCDYGYVCDVNSGYCKQPDMTAEAMSYLGGRCEYQLDCKFGTCKNGICEGQGLNEVCTDDNSCKPGLYCYTSGVDSKCVSQIDEGKTGCTRDAMCINTSTCINKTCIRYYSIKPSESVYCPTSYGRVNKACSTGFCDNTSGNQGKCSKASKNSKTTPVLCDSDNDCASSDGSISSECTCSKGTKAQAYCELLPGDPEYIDYLNIANTWVQSDAILKCNTAQRFESQCMKTHWDPKKYYTYMARKATVEQYPLIQDNDYCVSLLYTKDYWDAHYDYLNYAGN